MGDFVSDVLNIIGKQLSQNSKFQVQYGADVEKHLGCNASLLKLKLVADDNKEYPLIIKTIPAGEEIRATPAEKFFSNEVDAYTKLFPAIETYLEERQQTSIFLKARCYYASNKKYEEIIIVEDLSARGFMLSPRGFNLNFKDARIVLNQLAAFHALSFMLRRDKPSIYSDLGEAFSPVIFTKEMKNAFQIPIQIAVRANIDFCNCQRSFDIYKQLDFLKMIQPYDDTVSNEYFVFCHNDLWVNNIMFRLRDGGPVEAHLIDWQEVKIASPVEDLLFFIFSSVSEEVTLKHFNLLLKEYYTLLIKEIKRLGGDPESLFPENVYREHLSKYSAAVLHRLMFVMNFAIIKAPPPVFFSADLEFYTPESVPSNYKNKVRSAFECIQCNDLHKFWSDFL